MSVTLKPFPPLSSDEEAEDFVANADLTEYDPSEVMVMHSERRIAPGTITISDDLMVAALERAGHLGIPLEMFMRSAIERALAAD